MTPRIQAARLLILVLALAGWAGTERRLSAGVAPPAVTPEQRAAIAKYVEKGFPSPERPWSGTDYAAFANALGKIKADDSLPFPRKGDKETGPLFERVVSEENLRMSRDTTLPIPTRFKEASGIMATLPPILMAYLDPQAAHQKFGPELLDLMAHTLRSQDIVFDLAQKFYDGLSPEQKADPVRLNGLKQMKAGLAQTIDGILQTISETSQYEKGDLEVFAGQLPPLLAPIWPLLEVSVRQEFEIRIQKLSESHSDPAIRTSLTKLLQALKTSAKSPQ
jgi:hypothetical protein